jgi:hypothetical protein
VVAVLEAVLADATTLDSWGRRGASPFGPAQATELHLLRHGLVDVVSSPLADGGLRYSRGR